MPRMKTFLVAFKRVGQYRNRHLWVDAPSIETIEEPFKENLSESGYLPAEKQFEVTINPIPDAEGVYSGQLDYGLTGEFTIQEA